jgi:hypothetical protein
MLRDLLTRWWYQLTGQFDPRMPDGWSPTRHQQQEASKQWRSIR